MGVVFYYPLSFISQLIVFFEKVRTVGFFVAFYYSKFRWEEMVSCGLCWKGLREQFVAKSNGAEYVRCSNRACGYFCSLDELATYERVVQLDVACTFRSGDAPLCQHHRPCALRVSRSAKNGSHPYFTCRERWPCTFFCWADVEVTLRPFPSKQTFWRSCVPSLFFCTEPVCYNKNLVFIINKKKSVSSVLKI